MEGTRHFHAKARDDILVHAEMVLEKLPTMGIKAAKISLRQFIDWAQRLVADATFDQARADEAQAELLKVITDREQTREQLLAKAVRLGLQRVHRDDLEKATAEG